jgi:hypothetical protein
VPKWVQHSAKWSMKMHSGANGASSDAKNACMHKTYWK